MATNPQPGSVIVPPAIAGQRLRRSMSRRSGQNGSVERRGAVFVVRFWEDVAGQEKRVHRSVQICPVSGPGSMTKPEREHRAKEIVQQSGADTADHFRAVAAVNLGITFRQQSEWWIRHMQERKRKPVKPHTVCSWKSHLRWLDPRLGAVPLSDVNNLTLQGLVTEMSEAGFSPKTILNYVQVVKMVVASAIGKDGEEIYPRKWNHEFIDMPVVAGQRTPTFTAEEIQQIISRADGQFAVLYTLLAASGLRIGEALALQVEHYQSGTLHIQQGIWNGCIQSPKTLAGIREVDLTAPVAALLENFLAERKTGFIFRTNRRNAFSPSTVLRRNLHPILIAMGREKAGFHSFRRFRVTHLRKQGTPEDLLRFWIGHADKSITDGYSKVKRDVEYRKLQAERVGIGFSIEVVPCCPQILEIEQSPQVLVM
jgi:integrase